MPNQTKLYSPKIIIHQLAIWTNVRSEQINNSLTNLLFNKRCSISKINWTRSIFPKFLIEQSRKWTICQWNHSIVRAFVYCLTGKTGIPGRRGISNDGIPLVRRKNGNGFDWERNFRSNMRMVVAVVKKNSFDLSETEGSFKNLASVICLEAHRHTHARLIYAAPEDLLARNGPCQNKIIICSIYHGSQRR